MKSRAAATAISVAAPALALLCAACGTPPVSVDDSPDFEGVFDFEVGALTDISDQCAFSGGVVTLTLEADDIGVMSRDATGAITVNGVPCEDASVSVVRRIVVSEASVGAQTFVIDFLAGQFANGRAAASGWHVDLGQGTDELRVRGSVGADRYTAGVRGIATNSDANVDITFLNVESLLVSLGPGNDVFSGGGSAAAGAAMTSSIALYGGDGNDTLRGGDGDDDLYGGDGNDTFSSGPGADGADVLHGGAGLDTADYSARTTSVSVTIDGNADDGAPGEGDDVMDDVENVIGGDGDDTLVGSAGDNVLSGGRGNDTLRGGDGDDTLNGGAGDDLFDCGTSTDGADVLNGGAGVDTADYSGRTAILTITLDGRAGDGEAHEDDNVRTDVENVIGGSAGDRIVGSSAANVLDGRGGDDRVSGGAGNDTLIGGAGDDALSGDAGNDLFPCGTSTDGADVFEGGAGIDTVSYAQRTATISVTIGDLADDGEDGEGDDVRSTVENVQGGAGNDTLVGNALDNVLEGGEGDDTLIGGAGDDTISGGPGQDTILGGAGNDTLDGEEGLDAISCGTGDGDVVTDTTITGAMTSCELTGPYVCAASYVADASADATLRGNVNGGSRYDDHCPDGEALIGFDADLGASWDGATAVCGAVTLTCVDHRRFDLAVGAGTTLTHRGGNNNPASLRCPAGQVVVGMDVAWGGLVDGVRIRCAALGVVEVDRLEVTIGAVSTQAWVGNGGGASASSNCAAGEVARGAVIRAGNSLDALGLACGSPAAR